MTGRSPSAPDVIARFTGHARVHPEQLALAFGQCRLTYRQLDRWSAALARDLAAAGLRAGEPVAVFSVDRVETVAAQLAILRAGGWYVVVDPAQSPQRQDLLVRRTRTRHALVSATGVARLPDRMTCVPLDRREADPWQRTPDHRLPAYACFTSGTTGVPKGVQVTRDSLSYFVDVYIERLALPAGWGMAGFCPPDWDGAVIDLWVPLAAGGYAACLEPGEQFNPDAIARFVADSGVEFCMLPTALGELVLDSPHLSDAHRLRIFCVGGDRLMRRPPTSAGFSLWNIYGPTETTVVVTAGEVDPDGPLDDIPIGRPYRPDTISIVDGAYRQLPDGDVGEVFLGGPGVALGYLGDPRLTADAFRPGPAGSRWYRTGDLGRYRPDGELDFLGRSDNQVSVNGRRIEPEGILALLRNSPDVADAAIELVGSGRSAVLVAVVVPAHDELTVAGLRTALADWLAAHQMPDRFVIADKISRDLDGRLILDSPTAVRPAAGPAASAETAEPDELDELVAQLWEEAIRGPAGPEDFFQAGGNSLGAVQLVQQLQSIFDVEVPVLAFLDRPTVEQLTALLRAALAEQVANMSPEQLEDLLRGGS